jgi:hypothetical protein
MESQYGDFASNEKSQKLIKSQATAGPNVVIDDFSLSQLTGGYKGSAGF